MRPGDLSTASWLLSRALGEWRGAPLLDFTAEQFTPAASTRLQEARLSAVEAAAEVELALGRPDRALGYLLELPDAYPFRERLAELRILALYRSGRQADALAVYETIRLGLADELGVDPGPALRKLHLEVLRQEPSLTAAAPPVIADVLPTLPVALSSFVGRERELESVLQMLGSHRVVTLTGPGGSGKTRLATEVGTVVRAAGEFEVAFVDLSPGTRCGAGRRRDRRCVPASREAGPGRGYVARCATRWASGTAGAGQRRACAGRGPRHGCAAGLRARRCRPRHLP